MYLFSFNPEIWYQKRRFGNVNNAKIIQVFKLVNRINFQEITGPINKSYSFNSKFDKSNSHTNKSFPINKTIKHDINSLEELYETCIKSKYIRIIKSKKMTLITRRFQDIDTNLWDPHKLASILNKNYIALLLD